MKSLQNQSGQLVVEAVLLIAVIMGITMLTSAYIQRNEFANKLVAKPWKTLSGMIECGTWTGCGPQSHPASTPRNLSLQPDT
jgi:hypothetical protein